MIRRLLFWLLLALISAAVLGTADGFQSAACRR